MSRKNKHKQKPTAPRAVVSKPPAVAARPASEQGTAAQAADALASSQSHAAQHPKSERVTAKIKSDRHLPAPLAMLDADYSEVLRIRNVRYLIVIGAVAGALVFGWYLSSIFVPLLIALAIAYMLNPLVEMLERRGIARLRAVILIFVAVVAIAAAATIWFVAALAKDVRSISSEMGDVITDIEEKQDEWVASWNESAPGFLRVKPEELTADAVLNYLRDQVTPPRADTSPEERLAASSQAAARAQLLGGFQKLDVNNSLSLEKGEIQESTLKQLDKDADGLVSTDEFFAKFGAVPVSDSKARVIAPGAQAAASGVFSVVGSGLFTVLYWSVMAILIPIYTWFFLLGLNGIKGAVDKYLPGTQRPRIRRLLVEIDSMAKGFFRGRLIVIFIITVLTTILFLAFGVRYAFLLGLLAGAGIMVPLFSFIFSMIPAIVLMATGQDPSPAAIIAMVIIFSGIQALEQYYLTPKILGDAVELHPVTLLVGLFVMASLFGTFGALLAIPLTAIAKTLGREFLLPYFKSLAEEPSPSSGQTRVLTKT